MMLVQSSHFHPFDHVFSPVAAWEEEYAAVEESAVPESPLWVVAVIERWMALQLENADDGSVGSAAMEKPALQRLWRLDAAAKAAAAAVVVVLRTVVTEWSGQ